MLRLRWIPKVTVGVSSVFLAGLLVGRATLAVVPQEPAKVEPAGAAPANSTTGAPPLAHDDGSEHRAAGLPLPGRSIAARALECAVFLRGGPVYGAGVLIDASGLVLTADHVVDGVRQMRATFHGDSDAIAAVVVERDPVLDLALLRLERVPEGSQPARLGSVVGLEMGDEVFAMGAPRKMQFSLSRGVVSYVRREVRGTVYLQTDLAANEGSSGGPVLNDRGELIGVASFVLRKSEGLAFAVPVDYAYRRFGAVAGQGDGGAFESWLAATSPAAGDSPAAAENRKAVTANAMPGR